MILQNQFVKMLLTGSCTQSYVMIAHLRLVASLQT